MNDVDPSIWSMVTEALEVFDTSVLTAWDADERPFALRCRPRAEAATRTLRLPLPPDLPIVPGRASMLWHRHDGQLQDMRSLLLLGELAREGREWTLRPERVPTPWTWRPGRSSSQFAWTVGLRERSLEYMRRREVAPPPVDWDRLVDHARTARAT